ncbi:hypothetical protein HYH03_014982 [Edaphochlamys debaryana]|uniref:Protein kinase domain-containing protein n=1 Tax=Edaphochlamys debaryana TaxID=47281 RepID=A0A835XM62_9CHLO|nr:hypothetical protein HYH03_014982 [Edaphochlamys debaryana]|eukprot:KAG2486406.1 hypothetical protein HYH03_014982 [Edaphochlamys debaryana]
MSSGGAAAQAVPLGLQLPDLRMPALAAAHDPGSAIDLLSTLATAPGPPYGSKLSGGLAVRKGGVGVGTALPECWLQLLLRLQQAMGGAGDLGAAFLVPLLMGAQRVGAMLLAWPHTAAGHHTQPPLGLASPGALEALGACVAECCLGPMLPAVEQAAVAADAVASAASLSDLVSSLTSSLSTALSAELHVDLTVRLAVLPYKDAAGGVLFSASDATSASKTGMRVQPQSPSPYASPQMSTTSPRPAAASVFHDRMLPSPRPLAGGQGIPPPGRAQPAQPASLRGSSLRRRSGVTASTLCGPAAALAPPELPEDGAASTGGACAPVFLDTFGGASNSLPTAATGAAAAAAAAIAMPASALNTALSGCFADSIPLGPGLGGGRLAAQARGLGLGPAQWAPQSGALLSQQPALRAPAWKACPFTAASTLLSALLSGQAGGEVGPGSSQPGLEQLISAGQTATGSTSAAHFSSATVAAAPPRAALLNMRSQVVPDVPAFLHDPERPSKDVFSVVRRASQAAQGLASLVAISASWAPSAAMALLDTVATVTEGGGLGPAGEAELPALGLYIYSAVPLPYSLLVAARDRAAGLLRVLAPGAIRALMSWRPVGDQWAVLWGQALGVGGGGSVAAPLPSSSRMLTTHEGIGGSRGPAATGGSSPGGGGGLAGSTTAAGVRVLPVDAGSGRAGGGGAFQSLVASGPLPTPPPIPLSLTPLPSGTVVPVAAAGAGHYVSSGGAIGGGSAAFTSGRKALASCILDPTASASAESVFVPSNGTEHCTSPGRDQLTADPHSSAKRLTFNRLSVTGPAAPAAQTTVNNAASSSTSVGTPPPARRHLLSFLSTTTRRSSLGRGTTTCPVDGMARRSEFGRGSDAAGLELVGSGLGGCATAGAVPITAATEEEEAQWNLVEAETLSMLTETASDLGAVAQQHQMATLVSAFTTTLARSRTDADMFAMGSLHAEDDVRALTIRRAIGAGACSVVMLATLHAMSVAVKVILPLEDDSEQAAQPPPAGAEAQLPTWNFPASAPAAADDGPLASPDTSTGRDTGTSGDGASEEVAAKGHGPAAARATTLRRRKRLQALVRSARELAVLTSISHPNIVQVYSYCTRVVVEEPEPGRPQLRVVPMGAEPGAPMCSALIMECCDMGSLADSIDSGLFTKAARRAAASARANSSSSTGGGVPSAVALATAMSTAGTPILRAMYLTLLEVALALRHLHALNLVHGDVKPANVLLRSSATDPRGFTAKLTDFGFVSLVPNPAEREGGGGDLGPSRMEPVGTVTHMAPELFLRGSSLDSSIDCYAFGILMWEIYTGRAPYPQHADTDFAEVPARVTKEGLRPRFPADTPLHFKHLAQQCWAAGPSQRPTAAALVVRLQALLDASGGGAPADA